MGHHHGQFLEGLSHRRNDHVHSRSIALSFCAMPDRIALAQNFAAWYDNTVVDRLNQLAVQRENNNCKLITE